VGQQFGPRTRPNGEKPVDWPIPSARRGRDHHAADWHRAAQWRARRGLAGGRSQRRSSRRLPAQLGDGVGQGEDGGSSPGMAGDDEGGSAAGVAAVQWRRGTPVVVGGSGGVLKHKGEEGKVRGMATWRKGFGGDTHQKGRGRRQR
jgi:hypothetical protein